MVINERPRSATRRAGGIHCVYALEVPVARHDGAHTLSLAYLAHVADRLSHHLGADPGYTGLITRNPINPGPVYCLAAGFRILSRGHLGPVRVCLDHFKYMLDFVGSDETGIGRMYVVVRDWEPIHVLEGWIKLVRMRSALNV